MKLKNFINILKKYEKKINKVEAVDKYQFGECEKLVAYLAILDKKKGDKIELNMSIKLFDDEPAHHYIYKSSKNLFYDINGEFDNLYDLIDNSDIFDGFNLEDGIKVKNMGKDNFFITKNDLEDIKKIKKFDKQKHKSNDIDF